jgi:hypothetical protein
MVNANDGDTSTVVLMLTPVDALALAVDIIDGARAAHAAVFGDG